VLKLVDAARTVRYSVEQSEAGATSVLILVCLLFSICAVRNPHRENRIAVRQTFRRTNPKPKDHGMATDFSGVERAPILLLFLPKFNGQ
jgi:hypothetical protein